MTYSSMYTISILSWPRLTRAGKRCVRLLGARVLGRINFSSRLNDPENVLYVGFVGSGVFYGELVYMPLVLIYDADMLMLLRHCFYRCEPNRAESNRTEPN